MPKVASCFAESSTTAPFAVFDIDQARADWRATCATYEKADDVRRSARSMRGAEIDAHEDILSDLIERLCAVATRIVAAPASTETLRLKLDVFRHFLDTEGKEAIVDPPLRGGNPPDVAVAVVLDILTMIRRGDGAQIAKAIV